MTEPAIPGRPLRRHPGGVGTPTISSSRARSATSRGAGPPEHLLGPSDLRCIDQHGPDRVARRHQPFESQPPLDDEHALVERAEAASTVRSERTVVEAPEVSDPRVGGVVDERCGHGTQVGGAPGPVVDQASPRSLKSAPVASVAWPPTPRTERSRAHGAPHRRVRRPGRGSPPRRRPRRAPTSSCWLLLRTPTHP